MTYDEAFDKGVIEALGQYKLAGIADLYRGMGGFKGMNAARVAGAAGGFGGSMRGMLEHLKGAWQGMTPEQRAALTRQGVGAAVGGAGALLTRNKDEGALTTAARMGTGALLGGAAGHYMPQIREYGGRGYNWAKDRLSALRTPAAPAVDPVVGP